jgi:hypothetical protein
MNFGLLCGAMQLLCTSINSIEIRYKSGIFSPHASQEEYQEKIKFDKILFKLCES